MFQDLAHGPRGVALRRSETRVLGDAVAPQRVEAERHAAFEELALVHLNMLYNTAVQMTHNAADAEDLVQETCVKAYRFFDTFKRGTNCKAWLFKIMKNNFINAYRKRLREPAKVDFADVEPILRAQPRARVPFSGEGDVEAVLEELVEDDIKVALDQLPFEFRMVTILCAVHGFSYQEISEIMECPIGTVRSRLSRARKLLQAKLYSFARRRGLLKSA